MFTTYVRKFQALLKMKISALPIRPFIYILSVTSNNFKNSVFSHFMLIMHPQTTLMLGKKREFGILWSSCTWIISNNLCNYILHSYSIILKQIFHLSDATFFKKE